MAKHSRVYSSITVNSRTRRPFSKRSDIRGIEALFKEDPKAPDSPEAQLQPLPKDVRQLPLPKDGWRFKLDPQEKGHLKKWFAAAFDDSGWAQIAIEQAWQKAGYDYVGAAWYRRDFTLPEKPARVAGVQIQFEAVDETARVWINGKYVGEHDIGPDGWNVPFRLDVTEAMRWGQQNQITVRARNTEKAGGIWKPVSLLASSLVLHISS